MTCTYVVHTLPDLIVMVEICRIQCVTTINWRVDLNGNTVYQAKSGGRTTQSCTHSDNTTRPGPGSRTQHPSLRALPRRNHYCDFTL
jgi:hypothetical protein